MRSHLDFKGSESVLDVGCGDGKITADFAVSLLGSRINRKPWL
ncbi:hypothetical protein VB834_21860 [Limnoraphis robusta Tam1]|uniref:Uncharacterized protein n=1 Tax=Limnoraphis robusta CCNP1315 TaxID=3110306 RepID=A0ABU5U704_9CYAN|nr:hypothetical protein [Limnoraphis robusta]MEA5496645.1 hypothetical protein [Limnoraphis robusta BA-68 BA1]MEA5522944.1 hypothetical protein [Limnoraphis robusta CCNP1315]MEA5541678.1 hypothetical protein [Limnoraphis robusta Tam1]MEA5548662.1 hypothetical protein [Limnoraphis robusta CCNP1324]